MKRTPKHHVKLAGRVRVGPRGQVVIPAETREQLNVKPGDYLLALHIADSDAVAFVTEDKLQKLVNQSSGTLGSALSKIKKDKTK